MVDKFFAWLKPDRPFENLVSKSSFLIYVANIKFMLTVLIEDFQKEFEFLIQVSYKELIVLDCQIFITLSSTWFPN